jgi:hypothetical protein
MSGVQSLSSFGVASPERRRIAASPICQSRGLLRPAVPVLVKLGTVKQQPFQFPAKHLWGQGFRPAAGLLPGVLGNSGRRGQLERLFHDGPLVSAALITRASLFSMASFAPFRSCCSHGRRGALCVPVIAGRPVRRRRLSAFCRVFTRRPVGVCSKLSCRQSMFG